MIDFITTLVSSDGFIPHGHCYLWQPGVLWLHVISDSLIVLAYYSIPITLVYFVRKRKDLEFHWMFICFAVFILACGTTHLMEIWNVWHPTYWLSGSIKALTALASIPTAFLLVKLVPTALALPSPSTLKAVNEQMEGEIDERKRIEQNLYEKNIELENANLAKDRFLANMSHELRTPLNAIIGFSELLKDGMVGELINKKQHDFISEIFNSGEHLLSLINDILDLSKVETGKMTLDLEAAEVSGLLQSSLNVIKGNAYKHSIKLKLDLPDDAGRLMMDARKVKQIVYNLLSNAVKFTQDGGEVRVSSRAVQREDLKLPAPKGGAVRQLPLPNSEFEKFLEIKVCDSGIGIADADLPRLFQAFLQLDSSLARASQGSGLGLALVSRLVDLHGGTVAVASAPGHGSCFTVWLPWRNVPVEAGEPASVTADTPSDMSAPPQLAVEATPANSASTKRALIIEDDERAAEILRSHLEKVGFQVACASDAEHGLKMAEQERPDLIALDLLLPDMGGWEALDRIKADPELCSVPVVIACILADETKSFALGAAQVLQKPVTSKTLLDAIGELGVVSEIGLPLSVLVVGDDPQAIEMVEACLDGQSCNVLRAYGNEAIKAAQAVRPDLIILDLMMPDIRGLDVVETLKSRQDTADVPIFIITSKAITKADRKRLNGYVLAVMKKERVAPGLFLAEVERALHGRR